MKGNSSHWSIAILNHSGQNALPWDRKSLSQAQVLFLRRNFPVHCFPWLLAPFSGMFALFFGRIWRGHWRIHHHWLISLFLHQFPVCRKLEDQKVFLSLKLSLSLLIHANDTLQLSQKLFSPLGLDLSDCTQLHLAKFFLRYDSFSRLHKGSGHDFIQMSVVYSEGRKQLKNPKEASKV